MVRPSVQTLLSQNCRTIKSPKMKKISTVLIFILGFNPVFSQDWKGIAVPADAGVGKVWELQPMSDDFNYTAEAKNKGADFLKRWTDFYHNAWTGPGLTIWSREHSLVADGFLQIPATRLSPNKINAGCITSKERVIYPVYVEARAKITNSVLANAVWLLSPDDTQEIDIIEAYGSSYSEGAQKDQTWFAERMHLSHHVFIRSPFQDYQPTDAGSWYTDGTLWRNDFRRIGVYWKDPWNLEYYVDGKMVRKVSGKDIIDPKNFTNGTGLSKEMDLIINVEDQNWRSDQKITPTDSELANKDNHTFKVDWVRIYKPVNEIITSVEDADTKPLEIFPNPVTDSMTIKSEKVIKQLVFINENGALIKTELVNGNSKLISINDLKSGVYVLRILFENGQETTKKITVVR